MPKTATGDGGVLEGEQGLQEGDIEKLGSLLKTLRKIGDAAKAEG